ncbi:unnamed protein product [Camellia sinensis]
MELLYQLSKLKNDRNGKNQSPMVCYFPCQRWQMPYVFSNMASEIADANIARSAKSNRNWHQIQLRKQQN